MEYKLNEQMAFHHVDNRWGKNESFIDNLTLDELIILTTARISSSEIERLTDQHLALTSHKKIVHKSI